MNKKTKIVTSGLAVFLVIHIVSVLFFHFNEKERGSPSSHVETNAESIQKSVMSPEPVPENTNESAVRTSSRVPILMYHYIRAYRNLQDRVGENLSVSPQIFEQQIVWLKENSYQTVSINFFRNPKPMTLRPIVLTFDDGYQDAYDTVFPMLQRYQMTGTFYLIVNKIGTPGYLTWDEVSTMQTAGMTFGSHTLNHPNLTNISLSSIDKEITDSQQILEQRLGQEITNFCYPSGKYNDTVLKELQTDNYQTAVTTESGISNLKDNPLLLKRLRMGEQTNLKNLLSKEAN